jgi:hypothetical protein
VSGSTSEEATKTQQAAREQHSPSGQPEPTNLTRQPKPNLTVPTPSEESSRGDVSPGEDKGSSEGEEIGGQGEAGKQVMTEKERAWEVAIGAADGNSDDSQSDWASENSVRLNDGDFGSDYGPDY